MADFVLTRKKRKGKTMKSDDSKGKHVKRIQDIKFEICSAQFFTEIVDTVKKVLQEKCVAGCQAIPELVCYGLGNFAESYIARYQLALLLALREDLQVQEGSCEIYDPQFTPEELTMLLDMNFHLLEYNQEGKRECSIDKVTILYMPHCGKALYNNLLWKNWGLQLQNIVIIGNSFTHMIDSTPSRILQKTASYVMKIQSYTSEVPWNVPAQYEDVFNDTSIHTFPSQTILTAPQEFWENKTEPAYDPVDAEIILR